ncbi:MAG: hypothetical protein WDA75_18615 [Candidatus Latescibacterota bacterium]|jgi:hypothetical protein
MKVSDDGTVTFVQGRLEISIRPMTDEELNRQFTSASSGQESSLNPYTYGDWVDPELGEVPPRFTVFRLRVKNYMYPKIQVDPMKAVIIAQNGRQYAPLGLAQLDEYYQKFITGYTGNRYSAHHERMAIARNSGFHGEPVFSGQEKDGFVVFPLLHPDVGRIELQLRQVALRFGVWGEPLEQIDVAYTFVREIGRVGPDGKVKTRL